MRSAVVDRDRTASVLDICHEVPSPNITTCLISRVVPRSICVATGDSGDISPIALCLTARGSIGRGNGTIQLNPLAEALSHLFEPSSRVHAVNNAAQKAQALADVVSIAPDILFGHFCV